MSFVRDDDSVWAVTVLVTCAVLSLVVFCCY